VLSRESESTDEVSEVRNEGSSPHNQAMLWSSWNLPHNFYLDTILYYVDKLPYTYELSKIDPQYQNLPEVKNYFNLTLNLTWRYKKNVEFSLVGKNLLQNKHLEYVSIIQQTVPTEIPRMIYGKVEIKF
jgi:outer membrane receptor protein involved in Fe transport